MLHFSQRSNQSHATVRRQLWAQIKHFLLNVIMCVITEMTKELQFPVNTSHLRPAPYCTSLVEGKELWWRYISVIEKAEWWISLNKAFQYWFVPPIDSVLPFSPDKHFLCSEMVWTSNRAGLTGKSSPWDKREHLRWGNHGTSCARSRFELVWFVFHHKPMVSFSHPTTSLQ